MVKVKFLSSFETEYRRGDRVKGVQSVRCFPCCSSSGHRPRGFCGSPVEINVYDVEIPDACSLVCWAHLVPATTSSSQSYLYTVGVAMPLSHFNSLERTCKAPTHELLRGVVERSASCFSVVFNEEGLRWHYDWKSNKHKALTEHAFRVIVAYVMSRESLVEVVDVVDSPSFRIFSRGRNDVRFGTRPLSRTPRYQRQRQDQTAGVETTNKRSKEGETASRGGTAEDGTTEESTKGWGYYGAKALGYMATLVEPEEVQCPDHENLARDMARNRALDRLYLLMYTCTEYEPPQFSRIQRVNDVSFAEAKYTFKALRDYVTGCARHDLEEQLKKCETLLHELSSLTMSSLGTKNICSRWCGKDGAKRFARQAEKERDASFTWTPRHEDENYDPGNCVEDSIYAECRDFLRKLTLSAIYRLGYSLDSFEEVATLASQSGILFQDPFHPPSVVNAKLLCLQLYGEVCRDPSAYSAGESRFRAQSSHQHYAKDLLLLRRALYRRLVLDTIRSHECALAFEQFPKDGSLSPGFDMFNGVWVDADFGKLKWPTFGGVIVAMLGAFVASSIKSMFSSMQVRVTERAFTALGKPTLFSRGEENILLDGEPHPYASSLPLSMVSLMRGKQARTCLGFPVTTKLEDGASQYKIVLGLDFGVCLSRTVVENHFPEFVKRIDATSYGVYIVSELCIDERRRDILVVCRHDFLVPCGVIDGFTRSVVLQCFEGGALVDYRVAVVQHEHLRSVLNQNDDIVEL